MILSESLESVFKDTQPLVNSVLDGYNVCIFAYGQTGSGKTFTMVIMNTLSYLSISSYHRSERDNL